MWLFENDIALLISKTFYLWDYKANTYTYFWWLAIVEHNSLQVGYKLSISQAPLLNHICLSVACYCFNTRSVGPGKTAVTEPTTEWSPKTLLMYYYQ